MVYLIASIITILIKTIFWLIVICLIVYLVVLILASLFNFIIVIINPKLVLEGKEKPLLHYAWCPNCGGRFGLKIYSKKVKNVQGAYYKEEVCSLKCFKELPVEHEWREIRKKEAKKIYEDNISA